MPIFFEGIREKQDPYRFLSVQGVFDMLDMVRENTWKAGIEQKENRLEKVKILAGDFVKSVLITDQLLFWNCLFCGHGQLLAKNQSYSFLTTQVRPQI